MYVGIESLVIRSKPCFIGVKTEGAMSGQHLLENSRQKTNLLPIVQRIHQAHWPGWQDGMSLCRWYKDGDMRVDWIWTDQQFGAGLSQLTASTGSPIAESKDVAFSMVSSKERSLPGRCVLLFMILIGREDWKGKGNMLEVARITTASGYTQYTIQREGRDKTCPCCFLTILAGKKQQGQQKIDFQY